ncbi:hypothetical protein JXA02_01065 [candidate division KSB1 bacterium]|nr:hypothetical protein [candidate division KSB1 bacterium]RQW11074.1 MAG: hypothetical protein EH222_01130 [candidate division KSB1 bacterium]
MKKGFIALCIVLLMAPLADAKVKLVSAVIEPAAAGAGDEVMATVEFSGKVKNVSRVLLIPREYAYDIDQPFSLLPDASGKNVWSMKTTVPWEVPSGEVNLEVKAFDKKGKEIVIKEYKDQLHGKAGLILFEVK